MMKLRFTCFFLAATILVVLIASGNKVLAVADGAIDLKRADVIRYKRPSSLALAGFDLQFQIPKMPPGGYRLAAFRYGKDERSYDPIGAPARLEIPP